MTYLPPFVVHGSHTISDNGIEEYAKMYLELIAGLRDEKINVTKLPSKEYSNDLFETDV